MRYVTLFCVLGLLCGPVHAQNFFVEQSAPAHGDAAVPLADTVAFSFNKQVAISTDFNTEFVYRPSDSLTFDTVRLCLTFLGTCDAGDDIPRHVRYQVDHQPNTDYTWLVYGVQTVDGDSMSVPYTLRYTTAPEIGQGQVTGTVAEPKAKTSRLEAARMSLRKLADGLKQSELGRPVFEEPDTNLVESEAPEAPADRPTAHFKTIGPKAASGGPYTQILLVDEFSIDEDTWSVRAGDALIGSSGTYSLDFVRSGSYVPIAVRYTDGTSTEIDALGFHDPDGDGNPNSIELSGGQHTGIDLQLFEFPRTTARAAENLPVAVDSADQYASDQELRWIEAGNGIDPTGTAYEWTYRFYSLSKDLETEVIINPLDVTVDTSEATGFLTRMAPIPDGFVDTDAALATVLADGGQEFIDRFSPRNRTTIVSGGNLFWTDPPDATAEFWRVRFIGVSDSVETFERFVNMRSGDILPVEMSRFTVSVAGSAAELRWETASETNNAGFEVQHVAGDSTSRTAWETLGFVESNVQGGTTTEPQTYRFRAEDLKPGPHRFRLRQVDLDGTAHVSDAVAVKLRLKATLRLMPPSPNPVRETATLRFGVQRAQSATVAIYDLLGRKVMTLHDGALPEGQMQTVHLDADRLPSGVYFVRLRVANQVKTRKLTVVD
ncbi:MAG: T9SS type A sorting domain-containing protein [Salinibacter sp.]|uniref:T9SS type A sorting domain-containing protein n=1 Tax=Salinibacter sp. TaxID=2065818 RepID=UPI002FC3AB67